mgnify:CR=1 FL=1
MVWMEKSPSIHKILELRGRRSNEFEEDLSRILKDNGIVKYRFAWHGNWDTWRLPSISILNYFFWINPNAHKTRPITNMATPILKIIGAPIKWFNLNVSPVIVVANPTSVIALAIFCEFIIQRYETPLLNLWQCESRVTRQSSVSFSRLSTLTLWASWENDISNPLCLLLAHAKINRWVRTKSYL